MRTVDPFSDLTVLSECNPGTLVYDIQDRALGLVVGKRPNEPVHRGILIQFDKAGPLVTPCYRQFSDPRAVLRHRHQDYRFALIRWERSSRCMTK
jgi:hypothetical protein